MTVSAAIAKSDPRRLVGARARLAGSGQLYTVLEVVDAERALIKVPSSPAPVQYLIADIERDLAGVSTNDRFQPLVGQYRSMGPAGPEYEVVSIENPAMARIWIVGDVDHQGYEIQDILIDPVVYDGK